MLDKQRRLRAAKAAAAAAVIDPLNPNPEEDDLPPNKRRGHIGMGGAATPAAATAGGGSGKGYMSPGDVLRHNAAMKAAGAAVGATGTTAVQRPKARAPVSRTAVRAQSSRITRTYLAPETVGVPNSARVSHMQHETKELEQEKEKHLITHLMLWCACAFFVRLRTLEPTATVSFTRPVARYTHPPPAPLLLASPPSRIVDCHITHAGIADVCLSLV